jgi:hypothetical protein
MWLPTSFGGRTGDDTGLAAAARRAGGRPGCSPDLRRRARRTQALSIDPAAVQDAADGSPPLDIPFLPGKRSRTQL